MFIHPLVVQLRFTRSEFVRCLEGLTAEDAIKRLMPMNSISWMIGHLANQEHRYWVIAAQGKDIFPALNDRVGYGQPASTPGLDEMWDIWHKVTSTADMYLDTVTPEILQTYFDWHGKPYPESAGTLLQRNLYHY
ncbi:MAG: DinB family protein [Anaerolineales bacterium]|nr:DinB family protein [Anaerolineales bacterium]